MRVFNELNIAADRLRQQSTTQYHGLCCRAGSGDSPDQNVAVVSMMVNETRDMQFPGQYINVRGSMLWENGPVGSAFTGRKVRRNFFYDRKTLEKNIQRDCPDTALFQHALDDLDAAVKAGKDFGAPQGSSDTAMIVIQPSMRTNTAAVESQMKLDL